MSALADEIRAAVRVELDAERRWLEERLAKLAARPGTDPEEQVPLAEVARLCGLTPGTLRRAIRQGRLVASKGPKEWRVRRADLEAFRGRPRGAAPAPLDLKARAAQILATSRR